MKTAGRLIGTWTGKLVGCSEEVGAGSLACMKKQWAVEVGGLLLVMGALPVFGQGALSASTAAQVDATAAKVLAATGVPSASVALVQGGVIVYLKAYGEARLEPVMKAAPLMQYSVGSISKQFTAALLLLLVQDGKVGLDDPVAKYLPGLTRAGEVTLRQVLSMTSGYQDYWPEDYVMTSMLVPTTPQHILDRWGKKSLDFEPGTAWQYSNTNYVIAGRIAEIAGGKPLMEQLKARIFSPIGMTGVYDSDASHLPASDPTGYYRHALGPLRPAPKEGTGWVFAAGELAMPAEDLAKWNISIMNRTLLAPASYEAMFTENKLKNGRGTHYGLGVQVGEHDGRRFIEHSGEVSGFVSENIVFPAEKVAITVLTNEDASTAASELERAIAPLVLGAEPTEGGDVMTKAEARALAMFTGLQDGRLDRSQLTPSCNDYFSAEAVGDFASSLKPLGTPVSFKSVSEGQRGGMTYHGFKVEFPGRTLAVSEYDESDGKVEQFLVIP
jgi:D-alanyl-D-alanine carboxypeptidase